jgi:predicted peptidase
VKIIMIFFNVCLCCLTSLSSQNIERYKSDLFNEVDSLKNIQYGEAINLDNKLEKLMLDFYQPKNDPLKKRPLLICIHGGGFVNGDKATGFQVGVYRSLTKKGFVVSSINYRLGVAQPRTDTTYFEAMIRAVHDAKAAVRFFRKNAELYGIDTTKIYIIGGSAGSMTALNVAYLDEKELPQYLNGKKMGTLEGNSGNSGYSSKVHGIINCWGAMIDVNWLNNEDIPIYSIHGTGDKTVPYDDSYDYHGFKFGSKIIHEKAISLNISSGLRLFENAGHNIGKENVKIALSDISAWMFERVK